MQVVFITECKSCEISNQMFFNVTGYDINIAKYNYLVVSFRTVRLMNQRCI